jgi:hypothetical protein
MVSRPIASVTERDEVAGSPGLCPCGRGYVGHADDLENGHRCEDDPRAGRDRLLFRGAAPQWYRDRWTRRQRMVTFTGGCVICGRRCYSFVDGGDDPRGPLGDHADSSLRAEEFEDIRTGAAFSAELRHVPLCAICGNDEPAYREAVGVALRRWRAAAPLQEV